MNNDSRMLFEAYKKRFVKEEKALDPVGKEDADINNDGKVDKTDAYLLKKREAIAASINRGKEEAEEAQKQEQNGIHNDALFIWDYLLHKKKYSPQDAMKIVSMAKASFEHMIQ
jgi:hypothetical protein